MNIKIITEEELEANYLAEIMPRINGMKEHIADPNLSKLLSISNIYSIFYPVVGGNNTFINKCELYNEFKYNIEDDGDLSFVKATWSYHNHIFEAIRSKEQCTMKVRTFFAMYGHHLEIKNDEILKLATTHHTNGNEIKLLEYTACRLDWDFLDAMLAYQEIMKGAEKYLTSEPFEIQPGENRENLERYRDIEKQAKQEFDKYLKNSNYSTTVKIEKE